LPIRLERGGNPITCVDDWFKHAPPMGGAHQWQDGYSAKELAKAWCAEGVTPAPPPALVSLLSSIPELAALHFDVG